MEVRIDLTTSFKEAIIPDVFEFSETDDKPLKRRILAVSAGTHNGLIFTEEEINKMVEKALSLKEAEERTYFVAPLVLDHSYQFVDKVGSTFNLFLYDSFSSLYRPAGEQLDIVLSIIKYFQNSR